MFEQHVLSRLIGEHNRNDSLVWKEEEIRTKARTAQAYAIASKVLQNIHYT